MGVSVVYINSLAPDDNIHHQKTWSTLNLEMAWCLLAPSHFLKQCWLNINDNMVLWFSPEDFTSGYTKDISQWNMPFEWPCLKLELCLPGANELMNVIIFHELCQTRFICQVHMPMDQSIRGLILHVLIYFEKQCKFFFALHMTRLWHSQLKLIFNEGQTYLLNLLYVCSCVQHKGANTQN